MPLHPVLAEKLSDTLAAGPGAPFTARDARLPAIPGEVHSVIGMRRAGKTTFLRQLQAERRASQPAECSLFLSFDDDRLGGIEVDQLGLLVAAGDWSGMAAASGPGEGLRVGGM